MSPPLSLRAEPLSAGLWLADCGGTTLVLGLQWAPLLGRDVARLARQRARALGASHYVWSGREQASVGAVRAPRRLVRRLGQCQSAALVALAGLPANAVALLLEVPAQGCWFVAWHDRAVIAQTDRLYASRQEASRALDALRERYPELTLHGNLSLPGMSPIDWPQLFVTRHEANGLLRVHALSRAVRYAGLCAGLLAAALSWLAWRPAAPPPSPLASDALAAWHAVLAASVASAHWHAPEHLAPVLAALEQLPLAVTGWHLNDAQCLAERADWVCSARYARGPLGRYRQLADALPAGWRLRVDLLDGAELGWRLTGQAPPVSWQRLGSSADTEIGLASRLQTAARLFSRISLSSWQALPAEPPRGADGRALARPDGLPVLGTREVLIEGPLHAFSLFSELAFAASWQRLRLQLMSASGAGMASPRAQLSLQGWIYEKK